MIQIKNQIVYRSCRCIANTYVWFTDDGLLNHPDVIPIHSINAGDTGGTYEKAKVQVGDLKCYHSLDGK